MRDEQNRRDDNVVYWDGRRREQLGFVNNALLGLSLAGLILIPQLLGNAELLRDGTALTLAVVGVALVTASTFAGIVAALTRLADFRGEAEIARLEADAASRINRAPIESKRKRLTALGKTTWGFLWLQIGAGAAGLLALLTALLIVTAFAAGRVGR